MTVLSIHQFPQKKMYAEQDHVERAITRFERATEELKKKLEVNEGKPLTEAEKQDIKNHLNIQLMQLKLVGNLEEKLAEFRDKDQSLEKKERRKAWMRHSSQKLGRLMLLAGIPKPDRHFQAHHMIASTDKEAIALRLMLYLAGIKQDDPKNGCWLVNYEKNHVSWAFPKAVCHAWLNHDGYHQWLINDVFKGLSQPPKKAEEAVSIRLRYLRKDLLEGNVPPKAIKKKGKKVGEL